MFRWRYRFDGKLRDYTCGAWPTKSLQEIRDTHEAARQLVTQGRDPNEDKRIARLDGKATRDGCTSAPVFQSVGRFIGRFFA